MERKRKYNMATSRKTAVHAGSDSGVLQIGPQYGGLGAADLSLENISE